MTEYEEEPAPDYAGDGDDDDEHLHDHQEDEVASAAAAAAAMVSAQPTHLQQQQQLNPLHPYYNNNSIPDYYPHLRKRGREVDVDNPPGDHDVKPSLGVHHYDNVNVVADPAEVAAAAAAAEAMGMAAAAAEEEEVAVLRCRIASHPLFPQLLDAHIACLQALPVPALGAAAHQQQQQQLAQLLYPLLRRRHHHHLLDPPIPTPSEQLHLDHFMVSFVRLLQAFNEQLREQAHVYGADAMAAVTEIANAFVHVTGDEITSTDGSGWPGGTANGGMTDDEMMEEEDYLNVNVMGGNASDHNYDAYMVNSNTVQVPGYVDGSGGNFNNVDNDYVVVDGVVRRPPLPTSTTNVPEMHNMFEFHYNMNTTTNINERNVMNNTNRDYSSTHYNSSSASADMVDRTLMHHIRKELKLELKQNYRPKLTEVRDEILRKRRAAGGRQPKGQNTRDRSS